MKIFVGVNRVLVAIIGAAIALLSATIVNSPNLANSEITAIGTRWVYGQQLLFVQAWSHYSPQTLFFGALYQKYVASHVIASFLFEFSILAAIFACGLYLYTKTPRAKRSSVPILVSLAAMTAALCIPGAWGLGISPTKIATLFFALALTFYLMWRSSTKSFWLLGETSKNFRYLLLSGVCLSVVIFTSPWLSLLALPFFFDIWIVCKNDWREWLRWASLLIAPITAELWVWYSVLSSRRLLVEAWRAFVLDKYAYFDAASSATFIPKILALSVIIVPVYFLVTNRTKKITSLQRLLWLCITASFASLAVLGTGGISFLTLWVSILCAGILLTDHSSGSMQFKKIHAVGLAVLVIALATTRLEVTSARRVETLRRELVASYILPRTGTNSRVLFFGSDSQFHEKTGLENPTPFFDPRIFSIDEQRTQYDLEAILRGSSEADTPLFVIRGNTKETSVMIPNRLVQYISKHYTLAESVDGYDIYKRK